MRNRVGRRRRPVPSLTTAGVALVMLLASTSMETTSNTADAFALPRLRSRTHHHSIITPVRSSKAPLEFAQCSEEEESSPDKKINGERNGKEVRNGAKSPSPEPPASTIREESEVEHPFEIHLGRALDTLRSDYPKMLTKQPGEYLSIIIGKYDLAHAFID